MRILLPALILALLFLAGLLTSPSQAQYGPPLNATPQPLGNVEILRMPPVDVAALLAEDEIRAAQGLPPRFAQPIPVVVTPWNHGTWETLSDGTSLWRLRILSAGALSLNLGFTRYQMPKGGRLTLYPPDASQVVGPFTSADNETHGQLWSPIILSDEIVIEVSLPTSKVSDLQLVLTSVNHGYAEFGRPHTITSGSCNLDVVCSAADGYPQVDGWRDQIRSVAVISTGGTTNCTGFLVNNTAQDLAGYFMTANHCGINSGNAASLVTYWNYQNSYCRPVGSPASGGPGDGSLSQYNTGSYFRASYAASDFTLVELDDPINPDFNVYWAGWDATSADATNAVGIHHPNTDEKRISFEDHPTTTTSYLGTSVPGDGTHERITDWDLGTTEPGSSGSPLFNQDHRIIGQLHGGFAACGNDESDWYGRFSVSWNRPGSSPTNRLHDLLDPLNTVLLVLDGRNQVDTPFEVVPEPSEVSVCAPDPATYSITVTQKEEGYLNPVTLNLFDAPAGTSAEFSVNPVVPTFTSTLTISQTEHAAAGHYDMDLVGTESTDIFTTTISLDLFSAVPDLPTLLTPADGSTDQPNRPIFTWEGAPFSTSFNFRLDHSPLFPQPEVVPGLANPTYTPASPLQDGSCYWWSVQAANICGAGAWSEPFHFATANMGVSFQDDIESGAGNWSHQASLGIDHWAITTAQSHSPTHAWFVPDDGVVTDSRLRTTSPIHLGGGSTLTFWHRYLFQGINYDGAVLEISANGGSTWSDLGSHITANGYTGTIYSGRSNPLSGRQAWTGNLTTWTQVAVDLSSYAGQDVLIRWRLGCDVTSGDIGWYIDDVQVTAPLPPNPAPVLLGISPDGGSAFDGTPVVINGTGFISTPVLALGDTWLISTTLVSSTSLTAVVPAGLPAGTYPLTLYNGDCQTSVLLDAFTVVENYLPIEGLVADNSGPTLLGQATHLTATVTAGTLPTFTWDFGDGSSGEGKHVSHAYGAVGDYTAVVTATNSVNSAMATTLVSVVDVPITGLAAVNNSPSLPGETVTFTATIATGTNVTYSWDFGDGAGGAGKVATHVYALPGQYTATLTATNTREPAPSATSQVTILVPPNVKHYLFLPITTR